MNKTDLINKVVDKTGMTKANVARTVDATLESIVGTLKEGGTINLVGFGTFHVKQRAARKGRNLQTGEEIEIRASKAPGFKASKLLKLAVN